MPNDFAQSQIEFEERKEAMERLLDPVSIYGWWERRDGTKDALLLKGDVVKALAQRVKRWT